MRKSVQPVSLGELLESFFNKRLVEQQNVSPNSVSSYRDTWRLLLRYLTTEKKVSVTKLTLDMVTAEMILEFFTYLETERHCGPSTRNQRRAAIRAFSQHAILNEPRYMAQFERVLAIPSKRYDRKVLGYLTHEEMDAILDSFDRSTPLGRRDYALFYLMYNAGIRVSEATAVRCKDFGAAQILVHGKGGKERVTPLWPETVRLLRDLMVQEGLQDADYLFLNSKKQPITRSGVAYILDTVAAKASKYCPTLREKPLSPHTIRHTCAMHLLQSGADINLVRMWLGHVNLDTTHGYVEADLNMKRAALEKGGVTKPGTTYVWKPTDEVKAFLDTLGIH